MSSIAATPTPISKVGTAQRRCPQALTNELSAFARQNPDLVDFDAARGIVKFKSDVTFAAGSMPTLTPKAKEAIDRFAADPQLARPPAAMS